ncbi:MAG: hypothetical protein Kow0068_09290 [Marinilabiliales bacterium]
MRKYQFILVMLFVSTILYSQYEVGHTTIIFNDPSRSRDIETEIYYPANTAGEDVPIVNGNFPVLIFGHGFVMAYSSYDNFWNEFVPQGYIMLFPRTEGDISPDHGEFGLDLAFLQQAMQDENLNSGSIFYGAVAPQTAVMGHSMGGGSSFLAAEANPNFSAIVNFAAAETNPSAISAAGNIQIPALIFSGSEDCVASPIDNQIPMYDSLASNCKTYISIIGGGHCYFANYNFNCTFGESTCLPVVPITREEQHDVTFNFLSLWLDFTLKGNQTAFDQFNDSLAASSRITYQQNCISTYSELNNNSFIKLYPNPASGLINLDIPFENYEVTIYNVLGIKVYSGINARAVSLKNQPAGSYFIKIDSNNKSYINRVIKK